MGDSKAGATPVRECKFEVDASTSNWLVLHGDPVFRSYHGRVWIDPSGGLVRKIEKVSTGLPANHPIERIGAKVEYAWMKIDGKSYLLPLRAETLSCFRHSFECRKNDIEFRNYRKFEVESKLVPD